jgi:hypothetical protein
MGDILIGIGVLLAIIGPLLLIPVAWLLYRFIIRPLVVRVSGKKLSERDAGRFALGLTVGVLAAIIAASYYPGKQQFDALCAQSATPQRVRQVHVDGFYADRLFPYQAAQYLHRSEFSFVEAPDPYKAGVYIRYEAGPDGTAEPTVIDAPTSLFGFRQTFSELPSSITMTEKVIYERATDTELARAASINYMGGPLSLFLGSYGILSCPDIRSPEGSEAFNTFYNLENLVLRSSSSR